MTAFRKTFNFILFAWLISIPIVLVAQFIISDHAFYRYCLGPSFVLFGVVFGCVPFIAGKKGQVISKKWYHLPAAILFLMIWYGLSLGVIGFAGYMVINPDWYETHRALKPRLSK